MKLLEYEAKALLDTYSVAVPDGRIIKSRDDEVKTPTVIKSQVPTGGRGKAGGVVKVATSNELTDVIERLFKLPIKGHLPRTLLAEELLDIDQEYYLSLLINRQAESIDLLAHREGGIDIEAHDVSEFLRLPIDQNSIDSAADSLAELYDLPEQTFALADLLENLLRAFVKEDMTLLEINPLVLTTQNTLVAADAKIELDNSAEFRHPEWSGYENQPTSANFVTLNPKGSVATIANGAGLAMATVDGVAAASLTAANFLDVGGAATSESLARNFDEIMKLGRVEAIIINIFGGIVRCDVVAEAIIAARQARPNLPQLLIRLSGNGSERAAEILSEHDLTNYASLADIITEIRS